MVIKFTLSLGSLNKTMFYVVYVGTRPWPLVPRIILGTLLTWKRRLK